MLPPFLGILALPVFSLIPGVFGKYVPLVLPKARGQQAIANAVLLASSTTMLSILVQATLAASRRNALPALYAGTVVALAGIDRTLRVIISRQGLTTPGASPT